MIAPEYILTSVATFGYFQYGPKEPPALIQEPSKVAYISESWNFTYRVTDIKNKSRCSS